MRRAHEPVRTFLLQRELVPAASNQIERARQIVARLVAFVRVLRQTSSKDAVESCRNVWIELGRRNGIRRQDSRADFSERISSKGPHSRDHLVQHDAKRKKIGPSILLPSFNLFRR